MKKVTIFKVLFLAVIFLSSIPAPAQITIDEYGTQNFNRVLSGLGLAVSYVSIPSNPVYSLQVNGTIEMWIYPTSLSTNPKTLISKGATSNVTFQWTISNTDARMVFRIGSTDYVNSTGFQIPTNTWTHVAVTWSGGSNFTVRFYVNGTLSGSPVSSSATMNINTNDIRIGGSQVFPNNYFQGNIDEVRVWGDELTVARILRNRFIGLGDRSGANSGSAITSGADYFSLISSWNFNASGATAFDYIGGLNGTYLGSATSAATVYGIPIPYNFALKFNGGSNDYVLIPHNSLFNQTSDGSLELWFMPNSFSTEQILISKGSSPSTISFILGVMASTGRLYFGSGTNIAQNSTGSPLTLNQWNHIVVTWIQSGSNMQIIFYKNGIQNGNTSVIPYSFPVNSDPVRIGTSAPYNLPVRGWIDELRLWNSQLTAAQVAQNMFVSCRGISNSNLLFAFNFDGNLLNTGAAGSITASFNIGSTNTCRFSGYVNDTIAGAAFINYVAHTTVINRTGSPNPFPNGFALRTPFLNIPDNNPTGISDSITIYNPVIAVSSIEVFLSIRHTWVGDLTISIRAPNGQVRNIIAGNGANCDNVLSFFSDNFPDVVTTPNYLPPWGYVKPISIFGNFTGATVNGTWLIKCVDAFAADAGVLQGWGIRFNNVVSSDPVSGVVPDRFNLYQNYPNPFNPVTNIKFDLPKDVNVTVRIYDMLGREVLLIADGFYKAGTYSINFDGSNLSTGTYFYRIKAGDFTDTKKMVLVK